LTVQVELFKYITIVWPTIYFVVCTVSLSIPDNGEYNSLLPSPLWL